MAKGQQVKVEIYKSRTIQSQKDIKSKNQTLLVKKSEGRNAKEKAKNTSQNDKSQQTKSQKDAVKMVKVKRTSQLTKSQQSKSQKDNRVQKILEDSHILVHRN